MHGEQDQFANLAAGRDWIGCEGLVEGGEGSGSRLAGRFGIQAEQRLESAGGAGTRARIGFLESTCERRFGIVGGRLGAADGFEDRGADWRVAFRFEDGGPQEGCAHLCEGSGGGATHLRIRGMQQRNEGVAISGIFETADGAGREHLGAKAAFCRGQQDRDTGLPRLFGFEERTIGTVLSRHWEKKKRYCGKEARIHGGF